MKRDNDIFSLNVMSGIARLDLTGEESEAADLAMADGNACGEERCPAFWREPHKRVLLTNCSWMSDLVDISIHPQSPLWMSISTHESNPQPIESGHKKWEKKKGNSFWASIHLTM